MRIPLCPIHGSALSSLALCAALLSLSATAAGAAKDDTDTRYKRERAACDSSQDRVACLHEAAAARDEARRNQLDDVQPDYERNALARCDALPEAERDLCKRRTRGEGETRGSVTGGGIYREYRVITLPETVPQKNGQQPHQ